VSLNLIQNASSKDGVSMHIYTLNILEASSKDESFQAHLCTQQFKNLSNVGLQTNVLKTGPDIEP
jgi:hypothetical protein